MPESWPKKYYRWPGYLPYPTDLQRSKRPVPNRSSVDWPQAQFAPLYLAPGSASFQPYSYTMQDRPLSSGKPKYLAGSAGNAAGELARKGLTAWSKTARDGDNARLPNKADIMRYQAMTTGYGDGMAYELAPLQAAPHETFDFGALDGELYGIPAKNNGDCGCGGSAKTNGDCGCAGSNPSSTGFNQNLVIAGVAVAAALWYFGYLSGPDKTARVRSEVYDRLHLGSIF